MHGGPISARQTSRTAEMAALSYARARCSGVFGDGPVELVFVGSFASHVELCWTVPEFVAFCERLSKFCCVLLFDKAGVGLSDP